MDEVRVHLRNGPDIDGEEKISIFCVKSAIISSDDDSADDSAQGSRNAMQVVNTASVIKPNFTLEEGSQIVESQCRNSSRKKADSQCYSRKVQDTRRSTDHHTAGQRSVQNVLHQQLPTKERTDDKRGKTAACQRIQGVCDDDPLLVFVVGLYSEIKRWPVEPQEQSADHRKNIRIVASLGLRLRLYFFAEHPTDS